jgi:acetylornithine deacetylase
LIVEGDMMYGRGTTDCLGHVALVTDFFRQLAIKKPKLNVNVNAVFIVDEEVGNDPTIGVCGLMKNGELNHLKDGPMFWLDCSDKQPCIGTGGMLAWRLVANGKMFHSGFPQKAVNAIDLAFDIYRQLQQHFYTTFPPHPKEKEFLYECSSSMKVTNVIVPSGSLNQIKGNCTLEGDVRLVPFYKVKDCRASLEAKMAELSKNIATMPCAGPDAHYAVPGTTGSVELQFMGPGMDGIACNLASSGYKCLSGATNRVLGKVAPYSLTGSLPLVSDLKDQGFDVQLIGYGCQDAYHADNEYAKYSDMADGFRIIANMVSDLSKL